jgi:hypothetical protein
MARLRGLTLTIGFATLVTGALLACSDDAADKLGSRGGAGGGSSGSSGSSGASGSGGPNGGPPPEEKLFRALEGDLDKKCGNACHKDGTYNPKPPTFLAPPDAYKSVKSHPGLVTKDVFQSALLTKGPHAGPALNADPDFEKKVIEWLEAESFVISSQKLPSTDPVTLKTGENDIDVSKACIGGLTGVHLKFTVSMLGTILQISDLKVVAPAGTDVHVLKPRFVRVLAKPKDDGTKEIADPANSFENLDTTVPGGAETVIAKLATFSGTGWYPFDLAGDKIRIEAEKIEPGKVSVIEAPKTCKNVQGFTQNVLPNMRGQAGGFNLNCANCHGNGLAGLSLNSADQTVVCNQVLTKFNSANPAQSLIVTKVTQGPHNGGLINNAAGWTAVFVNNAGVF